MKRKVFIATLLTCVSLLFASCVSVPYDKPYGIWHNEEIGLTLDIDPEVVYRRHCSGVLVVDGEEREVDISFHHGGFWGPGGFDVRDGRRTAQYDFSYFSGKFRIRDSKLHYTVAPRTQERHGLDTNVIIFELIHRYER
jgi:hypothetical protein